jgi:hypothetical protein
MPNASDGEPTGVADTMAHRINNFLSRIVACAEGAIDAADNPERVRALMEILIECAENPPDIYRQGGRCPGETETG